MSANWGTTFHIFFTTVTHLREVFWTSKDTTSKPNSITLNKILWYIDLDGLRSWSSQLFVLLKTIINASLYLLIQTLIKVLEHSCSTGEDNVFIKLPASIDRARLDRIVNYLIKRCSPIIVYKFWMEEHLWPQESLISYINFNSCAWARLVRILLKFVRLHDFSCCWIKLLLIKLFVFLDNIFTDITISLLYFLCNFHWVLSWDRFSTISHLLQNKFRDIFACKWNVLNTTCNNETIRDWENVSHTIARVNDSTSEVTFTHRARFGPRYLCIESKSGLNTNK